MSSYTRPFQMQALIVPTYTDDISNKMWDKIRIYGIKAHTKWTLISKRGKSTSVYHFIILKRMANNTCLQCADTPTVNVSALVRTFGSSQSRV